jgi:hypothetical protein
LPPHYAIAITPLLRHYIIDDIRLLIIDIHWCAAIDIIIDISLRHYWLCWHFIELIIDIDTPLLLLLPCWLLIIYCHYYAIITPLLRHFITLIFATPLRHIYYYFHYAIIISHYISLIADAIIDIA